MRIKKEINIQIGEQVKLAREQAKLTQEQLAERLDVSTQYISDLERGVVGISIPTLKKLCGSLCISSDQILFSQKKKNYASLIADKCTPLSDEQFLILTEIVDRYVEAIQQERTSISTNISSE